ncbi:MAG TPA: formimidoylglutamase [Dinghuibacter sp.]|uniref:formimidoylglutamase n=1 Tax=Dinghuibacter sp. TaxID=2024697 RepID=UPI002B8A5F7C|nr:formimidoylglutamase [Dinghuibacter sp.]HTJ13966.1 formimidoylglutamase [Dinghuibacter sp.]
MSLQDFLQPVSTYELSNDRGFSDGQIGCHVTIWDGPDPDTDTADVVLLGVAEERGAGRRDGESGGPDKVREHFYSSYYWHPEVRMADAGNVRRGATLHDTYAALRHVVQELTTAGKTVIILGGSHDLTLGQYQAYRERKQLIEVTCVDALIDLNTDSPLKQDNFLLGMLTEDPNYIRHYNHVGFQSYYVHPRMLETLDKLHFDCYRVGKVREQLEEMEPVIRHSDLVTIDICAMANGSAPAARVSPNGFNGEDMCQLSRYAGLSSRLSTFGIYGYRPSLDRDDLTARQIAQMLWYFVDGRAKSLQEAPLDDRDHYNEFHTVFGEIESTFLQSKRTGRWWMQLPDHSYIACSYTDYVKASHNDIPERWFRAQERG